MNDLQPNINFEKYINAVRSCATIGLEGRIVRVAGIVAEADGPGLGIGSVCAIKNRGGEDIRAEVVGFNGNRIILLPLGDMAGIEPGSRIVHIDRQPTVRVGDGFLGRVIDGLGVPIDGKGDIQTDKRYPLLGRMTNPLDREIIREVVDVGVTPINTFITLGKGQRIAIMAGSGVGKSVLMGMIARNTTADISIIALIGERGREVREFVERNLGEEGLKRSVVIAATSDAPALVRIRGAYLATAMAEFFRDKGRDVVLMMDSITRFAMSLREVGLAAGEPPSAKGYTPSVFAKIPRLMERAGSYEKGGSITGIYSVLVEGDDMNEPIADAVRSTADGHVVLSRKLAHRGHYPAIDIMASISRVMNDIADETHRNNARKMVRILSTYKEAEDLINIGAYTDGSDPQIDQAKRMIRKINAFLQQDMHQKDTFQDGVDRLQKLLDDG